MGFRCGNTPGCKMCSDRAVRYQLIQHRLLEPAGSGPDFTRGTLEGDIAASPITFYRLVSHGEPACEVARPLVHQAVYNSPSTCENVTYCMSERPQRAQGLRYSKDICGGSAAGESARTSSVPPRWGAGGS